MARSIIILLAFTVYINEISSTRVRYDNYNIYQVLPSRLKHLDLLVQLEKSSDSLIFLTPIVAVDKHVNILVAPHKKPEFLNILDDNEVFYELVQENFQQILDAEDAAFRSRSATYDWTGYHTLEETYEWLKSLEARFPDKVKTIVGGKTYEGRDILGVKVSFKAGNKAIFVEGGIHAREWISPATVTYILNEILTSNDDAFRTMVESFDWYVFPHVNPDGFVYTHTTNRLWRKTRSRGTECYGADANRNWGFKWMEIGASSDECSETYAGKEAFSEIETKTLAEFVTGIKDELLMYVAFHSYSQLLLFAYGYTPEPIENHDDHQQIAEAAVAALSKRYGTQYQVGSSYTTIYPTSGSSRDYAYGFLKIPLVYSYELRPASSINGFVLPSAQIIPTCLETLDSLVAMISEAQKLGYLV